MDPEFWHERWREQQIGFHRAEVNPYLVRHHALLGVPSQTRVLVPLCGKSRDLAWLAAQGHAVVGVELSPLAVRAFFDEQGVVAQVDRVGSFERHRAGRIEILCGDLFALERELLGPVSAWFDRASLVAFPESMRPRYVQALAALLPADARGLLVSFDYEPAATSGPPFCVPEREVRALFEPAFELRRLDRVDILDAEPRFRARGITALCEDVYALVRRAAR